MKIPQNKFKYDLFNHIYQDIGLLEIGLRPKLTTKQLECLQNGHRKSLMDSINALTEKYQTEGFVDESEIGLPGQEEQLAVYQVEKKGGKIL
jgi:hypothetical protein